MNYLKTTNKIIKYNFNTLLKFEVLFKILLTLIFMPVVIGLFNITMKLTGYKYLTLENIFYFLSNPLTILLIIIAILFLTIITLFDISTILIIYDASYHQKKIRLKSAIKLSLFKCKNTLKIKNIPIAFMLLLLIPLLNIGVGSNVISTIKIPEFILEYIEDNKFLAYIIQFIYVSLSLTLMKWIYSIHYIILEEKDFKEARKLSKNLSKNNNLKDIFKIFVAQFLLAIVYIVYVFIGIGIIYFLNYILKNLKILESVIITIVWLFLVLSFVLFSILSNSISYALISAFFYQYKEKRKEKIILVDYEDNGVKVKNKKIQNIIIIVIVLAIIGGSILTYQVISGKANLNIESVKEVEITAHRGASTLYPENTMSAFKGAKELGADWIELDVQQTKDRKIVVFHDLNLSRIAKIDKNIIDMDYEELRKVDVGSHFDKKFNNERIPLLEEVIEFAKSNSIRLNIELKPTGKEKNFEKSVVELIKKYNYQDMCIVSSLKYNVLENVKKIDSDIKTVYVMSIAIGKITELEYADGFSIEATYITEKLVNNLHNKGKELLVWTVNSEENINRMINLNVDNIVTDDISLCKKLVIENKHSNLIREFIQMISNQ